MSIPTPNLDNRTFEELFEACKRRIPVLCPEWTDLGESDPGIVLLQLFSFLTETMLYQLNRLPCSQRRRNQHQIEINSLFFDDFSDKRTGLRPTTGQRAFEISLRRIIPTRFCMT